MSQKPNRITLLTDFGTVDGYVAAVKGVIAAISPAAIIDDATHDIAPGDVAAAAFTLARYWDLYPPGTTHLIVVDPGVGSSRRALAATVAGRCFVAPDNGVLTRVLDHSTSPKIVSIENHRLLRRDVAATFHGRDIFAPAAAHLARGVDLQELGPAIDDPVRLDVPTADRQHGRIGGSVVAIDRFGNLITNVPGEWVRVSTRIYVAGNDIGPLRRTYADVAPGEALALVGSTGALEVSVRDGSAALTLAVAVGAEVLVESSRS